MAVRLIDADELKKRVCSYNPVKYTYEYGDVISVEDIDNAPTIDAVLVVRCRDCKWWNKDAYSRDDTRFCYVHSHYLTQDYFCATGERRCDAEKVD